MNSNGNSRRTDAEFAGTHVNHALLRKKEPHKIARQPSGTRGTVFTTVRSKPTVAAARPSRINTHPELERRQGTYRGEGVVQQTGITRARPNTHDGTRTISDGLRRKDNRQEQQRIQQLQSTRNQASGGRGREQLQGHTQAEQRNGQNNGHKSRSRHGVHFNDRANHSRDTLSEQQVHTGHDRHRQLQSTTARPTSNSSTAPAGLAIGRKRDVDRGGNRGEDRSRTRADMELVESDGVSGVPGRPELEKSRSVQRTEEGYLIPSKQIADMELSQYMHDDANVKLDTTIARQLAKVIRAKGTSAPRRKSTRDVATTLGLEGTSVRPAKKQISEFLKLHFHFKLRHALTYYTLASQVALIHNIMEGFADSFGWTFLDIRKTLLEMAEDRRKAYRNKRKLNGEWSPELQQKLNVPRGSVSIFKKRPLGEGEVYDWSDSSVERERIRNRKKLKEQMTVVTVAPSGDRPSNSTREVTPGNRSTRRNGAAGDRRNNQHARNAGETERDDPLPSHSGQENESESQDDLEMDVLFPRNAVSTEREHQQNSQTPTRHIRPSANTNASSARPLASKQIRNSLRLGNTGRSSKLPTPSTSRDMPRSRTSRTGHQPIRAANSPNTLEAGYVMIGNQKVYVGKPPNDGSLNGDSNADSNGEVVYQEQGVDGSEGQLGEDDHVEGNGFHESGYQGLENDESVRDGHGSKSRSESPMSQRSENRVPTVDARGSEGYASSVSDEGFGIEDGDRFEGDEGDHPEASRTTSARGGTGLVWQGEPEYDSYSSDTDYEKQYARGMTPAAYDMGGQDPPRPEEELEELADDERLEEPPYHYADEDPKTYHDPAQPYDYSSIEEVEEVEEGRRRDKQLRGDDEFEYHGTGTGHVHSGTHADDQSDFDEDSNSGHGDQQSRRSEFVQQPDAAAYVHQNQDQYRQNLSVSSSSSYTLPHIPAPSNRGNSLYSMSRKSSSRYSNSQAALNSISKSTTHQHMPSNSGGRGSSGHAYTPPHDAHGHIHLQLGADQDNQISDPVDVLTTPEPTAPLPLRKSMAPARRTSPNRGMGAKPKLASPTFPKSSQMANPRQRQQTTIKSILEIPTEAFSTSSLPPPVQTKRGRTVTRAPKAVQAMVYSQKKAKKNQLVAAARTERSGKMANSQQLRMMHSTNQTKGTTGIKAVTTAKSDTTLGSIHVVQRKPAQEESGQRSVTSKAATSMSTSISKMAGRAAIGALFSSASGTGSNVSLPRRQDQRR